ncbi:MAG: transcription antitermination factor NusB [Firmicutes bacterium]|nr:transcription antitermination factor NusB [Bacillota bacterium]
MTRNEAREKLMQIIYEMDASKALLEDNAIETASSIIKERLSGNHITRGNVIVGNIIDNLSDIDETINKHSTKWKTTRMPKVDLAIMRLAIGEIRYNDEATDAVVINEAINMAKKYSTDNSAKFIHGVLGAVLKG